jgi:hypothetical protein
VKAPKTFVTESGKTIRYGEGRQQIVSKGLELAVDAKRKQFICLSERVISKDLYDLHYAPAPDPEPEVPLTTEEQVTEHGMV